MKVTGILLNQEQNSPFLEIKEIEENNLDEFYEVLDCNTIDLDCNTIDIVVRKIGTEYFDIVCDDEGLFKENPRVSAVDKNGKPMLVGNLFICKHDNEGRLVSLSASDFACIQRSVRFAFTEDGIHIVIEIDY